MAVESISWREDVFQPLLIGGMVGSITLALADLVHYIDPDWNATYVIVVSVLAAVEAHYSYRLIKSKLTWDLIEVARFRLIELAALFLLLRLASFIGRPWLTIRAQLQLWPRDPLRIIDAEMMVGFLLVTVSWWLSTSTAADLDEFNADYATKYEEAEASPYKVLVQRIFGGGAILMILTGLSRLLATLLADQATASMGRLTVSIMFYFLLSIVLLGQLHYAHLHTYWSHRKITIGQTLSNRWVVYTILFVGLAALIAILLPTSYTVGFLDVLAYLLGWVQIGLSYAVQVIMLIVSLPLFLLARLLGDQSQPPTMEEIEPLDPPTLTQPSSAAVPWWSVVRSILFWVLAIGGAAYVLQSYLRDRTGLLRALRSFAPIRLLQRILSAGWAWLTGVTHAVGQRLPRLKLGRRPSGQQAGAERRPGLFRLGALSPRERTIYYYLSILRRAGKKGFPRHDTQTPNEYARSITPHLPEGQDEMHQLTADFIEARYSQHPIDRKKESIIRAHWKRVKAAIRALGREKERKH